MVHLAAGHLCAITVLSHALSQGVAGSTAIFDSMKGRRHLRLDRTVSSAKAEQQSGVGCCWCRVEGEGRGGQESKDELVKLVPHLHQPPGC